MAERLGITREWISKLETGDREVSELLQIKIARLENENPVHASNLKSGGRSDVVREDPPSASSRYGLQGEASTARPMPNRTDCESYLRSVLDHAEREGAPENIPAIYHRLKKGFPLDEWEQKK